MWGSHRDLARLICINFYGQVTKTGGPWPPTPPVLTPMQTVKGYPNLDSYTNLTLGRHYTRRYNQLVANVCMYVTVGIFL